MEVRFRLLGRTIDLTLPVADCSTTLGGIVPVAQWLSSQLSASFLEELRRREGTTPRCRKGCCACCHYPIPLSVPEAIRIAEAVQSVEPDLRGAIFARFRRAAGRLVRLGNALHPPQGTAQAWRISDDAEAGGYDAPCPFLHQGACLQYPTRPIACREHFSADAPEQCEPRRRAHLLELPVSILEALVRLTARLEGRTEEIVFLPQALSWFHNNTHRARRVWNLRDLCRRLIGIVEEIGAEALQRHGIYLPESR